MTTSFKLPELTNEDYDLVPRYPATTSRGKFYLLQNNTVIGRMRMASAMGSTNSNVYSYVNVEPDDEATKEFFKDDYTIAPLGMVVGLRYDGYLGRPMQNFTDEPENRHKGTEIVDSLEFDFGIAHPRYASVKGWAAVRDKPKPSIKTKQLKRRPRSSNKIKKIK
jgi:hypothetical protein